MLAQTPDIAHAFVSTDDAEPDNAIVTIAVRGKATCELRMPQDRYDGFALMELLAKADH